MKISSVSEMRAMDHQAGESYGITPELLMENAGLAAFNFLARECCIPGRSFLVFCGSGNNGGDGLVIARQIHSAGGRVKVFILSDPAGFKDAARLNYEIATRLSLDIQLLDIHATTRLKTWMKSIETMSLELSSCDVIVDAIFGTGLTRPVEGLQLKVIELINESGKPVLSVDIPSGVHGDSGQVLGAAVRATWTVTFGLPKTGCLLYPGFEYCGRLYVAHISFPPSLYQADALKTATNDAVNLPPRKKDGHKGDFGQALFIAGAAAYLGAPYFSALSFLKAGGGYSRLAAPRSITPFIAARGSEIVFIPQMETASGSIARENKTALLELAEKMDIIVLGCGLSLDAETQQLARELAAEINKPLLIDGDGISAVCSDLGTVRNRQSPTVLTPHPGEMARLTGLSVEEIRADALTILRRTAADLKSVIVLKGAHSLIGYPDGQVFVNLSGNSGMATAGSGDVLSGTIAAMYGLGLPLPEAVRKGVYIHGLAGDLAAESKGEDGITAQDIMEALPLAVKCDRQGASGQRYPCQDGGTVSGS